MGSQPLASIQYEDWKKWPKTFKEPTHEDWINEICLLKSENAELKSELETERVRLAACGVAAMANTESTVAKRITPDNPYWSASYKDVCNAVDREMKLRATYERAE